MFAKAVWNPKNKNDLDVYKEVQNKLQSRTLISQFSNAYNTISQLLEQKTEFTREYYSLIARLGRIGTIDNFVSVGDSGKLVPRFQKHLGVKGDVFILHDKQRVTDIIERGTLSSTARFIEFDLNHIKDSYDVPENYIDLVTINQGLHHIPLQELPKFLKFVYKILRDDGLFVIREHDATKELLPLIDVAHSTFNAVTGVSLEEEKLEIRGFRTIEEWRELVTSFGFLDLQTYELQDDDSTEDFMIAFAKPSTKVQKEPIKYSSRKEELEKKRLDQIDLLKQNYEKSGEKLFKSNPSSCHWRLPEWMLVRVTEAFSSFMHHTVFYRFPFLEFITLYWRLMFEEMDVVAKRFGTKTSLYGYGPTMNTIIGVVFTIVFLQMWLICLPIRLADYIFSGKNDNIEQIVVSSKSKINFEDIHPNIKVLKGINDVSDQQEDEFIYLLQTPRHIPFNQICHKLAELKDVDLLEVGGNSNDLIQLELIVSQRMSIKQLVEVPTFEHLFDFEYPVRDGKIHVAVGVKIKYLLTLIRAINQVDDIKIQQIMDFLFA
jgi:SAM-dependent methyltransferase